MKRRKKLWIACAALAVVVACTLALVTRSRQFEFLRGATVDSVDVSTNSHGPEGVWGITEYQLDCTITEFNERARKELTSDKGWRWPDEPQLFRGPGFFTIVENALEKTVVSFGQPWNSAVPPLEWKGPVSIQVIRPATPIGRLRYWAGFR
ncbi:MAG: hypothetical protein WD716_13450 [Fimbriimonadaceae bacterium]